MPLLLYGDSVCKRVLNRYCHKAILIRIQRLTILRIAKAFCTVSNEALCVIHGIKRINIKIEETRKCYDITEGIGTQYDKEKE